MRPPFKSEKARGHKARKIIGVFHALLVRSEVDKWAPVIRRSGVVGE